MKTFEYTIKDELGIHARPQACWQRQLRLSIAKSQLQRAKRQ